MAVNANKPAKWKQDIAASIDFYNAWFIRFAPKAYRETRRETTAQVLTAFEITDNLQSLSADVLMRNPSILQILRMATAPPIARDRIIGLAGVSANLVYKMEKENRLPPRMSKGTTESQIAAIGKVINKLLDRDIFPWLASGEPTDDEGVHRAATVVADRLCGAVSDPIIRNAQEQRQLFAIEAWLDARGYQKIEAGRGAGVEKMPPGTYAFRMNVPVHQEGREKAVNIPIDAVV